MVTDTRYDPLRKEYGALASKYDRKWAAYVEATIRETLRRMPLSPGDRILDVACGTGTLLRAVATSDVRVTLAGVDATPEMLEIANSRIGSLADLRHGRAESLPFEDEAFDTVVTTNAFHFFRQPETALHEMWRVTKSGGRMCLFWPPRKLTSQRKLMVLCVRFGSKADIKHTTWNVRFTPNSGHKST